MPLTILIYRRKMAGTGTAIMKWTTYICAFSTHRGLRKMGRNWKISLFKPILMTYSKNRSITTTYTRKSMKPSTLTSRTFRFLLALPISLKANRVISGRRGENANSRGNVPVGRGKTQGSLFCPLSRRKRMRIPFLMMKKIFDAKFSNFFRNR